MSLNLPTTGETGWGAKYNAAITQVHSEVQNKANVDHGHSEYLTSQDPIPAGNVYVTLSPLKTLTTALSELEQGLHIEEFDDLPGFLKTIITTMQTDIANLKSRLLVLENAGTITINEIVTQLKNNTDFIEILALNVTQKAIVEVWAKQQSS